MSYYDYRQDEDYLARQDEDAEFSFVDGQNDALELVSPQEPPLPTPLLKGEGTYGLPL